VGADAGLAAEYQRRVAPSARPIDTWRVMLEARRMMRPRGFGRLLHFGPHPWIALLVIACVVVILVVWARRRL
jgi:hypothetical protein